MWFNTRYLMNCFLTACIGLYVPLMLASESFDKNSIGRRVEHVELVFVIEMACKTKKMLMRAQHEKIKKTPRGCQH